MPQLFRAFLLKEVYGWDHETALVECLRQHSGTRRSLEFDSVPDQSTLWRSWNKRFSADLRETVERTARTLLINAQNAVLRLLVTRNGTSSIITTSLGRPIQTTRLF
nr:transposase [Haloarcula sp. Atlit-47R]